jgi:predicted HTH domain antitoxin
MQLGSIELLDVNAQALHKEKITKRAPRRRIMQLVVALLKERRVSVGKASRRLSPKCSLVKSDVRTYTVYHA